MRDDSGIVMMETGLDLPLSSRQKVKPLIRIRGEKHEGKKELHTEEYNRDALSLAEWIGFKQAAQDLGIDKSMMYH